MQTDPDLKKELYSKNTIITAMALIALLISVSPYIVVIIQIGTDRNTQAQLFERIYWNAGWLISLCLSVFVILKGRAMQFGKKWFKVIILLVTGISILLSCLWALLVLIILPQLPPA